MRARTDNVLANGVASLPHEASRDSGLSLEALLVDV
jgi:hypothetical protein